MYAIYVDIPRLFHRIVQLVLYTKQHNLEEKKLKASLYSGHPMAQSCVQPGEKTSSSSHNC